MALYADSSTSLGITISVNQLEGKLNLPRVAGSLADYPKPEPVRVLAGSPMVTMLKRLKNSERNCRSTRSAPLAAAAEGRVFDEREVEVVEGRAAECVAAQRAEAALIRSRSAGDLDGDVEEVGGVVCAFAEVVLANRARGGEIRLGDLVGAVDPCGAVAGLLNTGVDSEWRTGSDARNTQQFPSVGDFLLTGRGSPTFSRCRSCATLRLKE